MPQKVHTSHGRDHLRRGSDPSPGLGDRALNVIIEGLGPITTGVKCDYKIDDDFTIIEWHMLADVAGSMVIDIWKDVVASFPPTIADTITASAKPTLSSAAYASSLTLTGWTTAVYAGDVLRFNVDSASTITRICLALRLKPTQHKSF
jgi:hypothetical protein